MTRNGEAFVVVFVTVPDAEVGEKIAQAVVQERLAACVNRVPGLVSLYHWKGEVVRDQEELLIIKTRAERFAELATRIQSLHPYTVPEIIALPITAGHPPYLAWINAETEG